MSHLSSHPRSLPLKWALISNIINKITKVQCGFNFLQQSGRRGGRWHGGSIDPERTPLLPTLPRPLPYHGTTCELSFFLAKDAAPGVHDVWCTCPSKLKAAPTPSYAPTTPFRADFSGLCVPVSNARLDFLGLSSSGAVSSATTHNTTKLTVAPSDLLHAIVVNIKCS